MKATTIRIKKEARALFWPWCAVIFAGALPLFPHPSDPFFREGIPFLGFLVGIPLLAALSFGNEFHCRTLSLLLSQPVGRMEIWREKLMVAGVAVASALFLFWYGGRSMLQEDPEVWLVGIGVMTATASVPFWTLLARSTIGGLALLNVSGGFVMILWVVLYGFGNPPPVETIPALSIAALGYAVLMLWLSGRKLARFQVTGGLPGDDLLTAGPNVMPEALAGWFRYRPAEPFFNLMRKELRLLRPVWLLGLLFAAYLIGLAVFRLIPDAAQSAPRPEWRDVAFILPFVSLLPLMAILAGCLSLGEERTSGTHSWHLTLPVAARQQWLVKLLMGLFTGFVCAALLPVSVLLAHGFIAGTPFRFLDPVAAVGWLIVVPLMTLAAFWCACAANGTVRAAIWIFPVTILINEATAFGFLMAQELAKITGVSWFQHSPLPYTSIPFTRTDPLLTSLALLPVLLLAVIQSYRLFRTQPQDSVAWMLRRLLPLALAAFMCGFVRAGVLLDALARADRR